MNFFSRPYHLLVVAGVLFLPALVFTGNRTMDIHLHDTYYIISPLFLFLSAAVILLLLWGVYRLLDRFLLSKFLTWLHTIITVFAAVLLLVNVFQIYSFSNSGFSSWTSFNQIQNTNQLLVFALLVSGIAQLLFVINIVGGILKMRFH
jgi:cytochrome c oxidase subunit I